MCEDRRRRLERLWERHRTSVSAYLLRRTDPETAADCLSEVFTVAWRRLDDIPDEAAPWLLGVARRILANHRRGARRRRALAERMRQAPTWESDPADDVAEHEVALRALRRLRPQDREILMLVAWDGLRPAEAAAALGVSGPTFSVRLHRARRRLELVLQSEESSGHRSPRGGDHEPRANEPEAT